MNHNRLKVKFNKFVSFFSYSKEEWGKGNELQCRKGAWEITSGGRQCKLDISGRFDTDGLQYTCRCHGKLKGVVHIRTLHAI